MPDRPTAKEIKYWHPVLCDKEHFDRLRRDYPEDTEGMSDEDIHEYYDESRKYSDVWDNIGDARADWEMLADDWFRLRQALAQIDTLRSRVKEQHEGLRQAVEKISSLEGERVSVEAAQTEMNQERELWRDMVTELESLVREVTDGITHSPHCSGECIRCRAERAEAALERVRGVVERRPKMSNFAFTEAIRRALGGEGEGRDDG